MANITSQSSTGFKMMSVPEKIQLTSTSEETRGTTGQYKPMKVPDKITLDDSTSSSREQSGLGRDLYGGNVPSTQPTTGISIVDQMDEDSHSGPRGNPQISETSGGVHYDDHTAHRVQVLEDRVQRLEDQFGRINISGPSRFWYVVTFSSWMMVPLVVVFMFCYRRNL